MVDNYYVNSSNAYYHNAKLIFKLYYNGIAFCQFYTIWPNYFELHLDSFTHISGTTHSDAAFSYHPDIYENPTIVGSRARHNIVNEVIYINDRTCALSLGNDENYDDNSYDVKGIYIFTKTANDNICIIRPSKYCANINPEKDNYLSAITYYSRGSYYYTNIPYEATLADKTVLNPIIVNGDEDWCPGCFYTPITQYKLDYQDDAIIIVDGEKYYYNGFIAVKLDDE